MKKIKYLLFSLVCMFSFLFVYAKNEITVESMVPIYEEDSGVEVFEDKGVHKVVFNDKDQIVKYNIKLKNNTKDDISIDSIKLPDSSEEFFKYRLFALDGSEVLDANSTNDVVLSLETVETEGWGRNFNVNFFALENIEVANPNTNVRSIVFILLLTACLTSVCIVIVKNKKIKKYIIVVLVFGSVVSFTNAKDFIILPIKLNVSFNSKNIMKANSCVYDEYMYEYINCGGYWDYAMDILNVNIMNKMEEIEDYEYKFDVSLNNDGRVIAYLVTSEDDSSYFDLYLIADGLIYANEDASHYFYNMYYLTNVYNIRGLSTSNVTNMSYMFANTGSYSDNFTLDVSGFDTSKVTDMSYMFNSTGYLSSDLVLDVSGFDTSNVTNMSEMFSQAGFSSSNFKLDLSNFDTSNVTNMSGMFRYVNLKPDYKLDLSSFDTSRVTDMSYMFADYGKEMDNFELDLSNFDTSKVTDMSYMFDRMGYNSQVFKLDLSNFDTSNVVDMSGMFSGVGHDSDSIDLDITKFNTKNVTKMSNMFYDFAFNAKEISLDLRHFDTSKVTDMSGMFSGFGMYSEHVQVDVSKFNTKNVESMFNMFSYYGYSSKDLILDLSNFDTSKVNDMSYMFYFTAYDSENVDINVSSFNTGKVESMAYMFNSTGYNCDNFDLDLNSFTFDTVSNLSGLLWNAGFNSKSFDVKLDFSSLLSSVQTGHIFDGVALNDGSSVVLDYSMTNMYIINDILSKLDPLQNIYFGEMFNSDLDSLLVGDIISIDGEAFYIIKVDGSSFYLLPRFNIHSNNKQSSSAQETVFSNKSGWVYNPSPKDIDVQIYSTAARNRMNNYVNYLKNTLNDENITADFMSVAFLKELGCEIEDVSAPASSSACQSTYFANGKYWWTKSAVADKPNSVYYIGSTGGIYSSYSLSSTAGVRPYIIVSKDTLSNYYNS